MCKRVSRPQRGADFIRSCAALILVVFSVSLAVEATADDGSSRFYRTRDERREAGVERRWTPWLSTTSLAELEWITERYSAAGNDLNVNEKVATLQLGVRLEPVDFLNAEIILEYDTETDDLFMDEGAVIAESEPWELAIGKYYLPFGQYYTSFITDPVLILGEYRTTAATVAYDFGNGTELSVFGYRGRERSAGNRNDSVDFGIAFETRPHDQLVLHLSGLTGLADSGDDILEDQDGRVDGNVPGLSGQILWLADDYEISFEALGAITSFRDLGPDRNQPFAWNLELVYVAHPKFDVTLRIEGSREIEDAPELRYGLAFNARIYRDVSFTIEALHGRFAEDLAVDDDGVPFTHVNAISAQFDIAF